MKYVYKIVSDYDLDQHDIVFATEQSAWDYARNTVEVNGGDWEEALECTGVDEFKIVY